MKTLPRRSFLRLSAASLLASGPLRAIPVGAQARPPRIKVGQIGTGHAHAAGKMETFRKSDDWEVVGVVENDPKRREGAAKLAAYAGLPWVTEEQLLNTAGLQAVAVETEVKDLVTTATRCVAAGMHLHLDKPGGESLPAFRQLFQDATRRKLTIQMGYMLRYNPAFQQCFELVRSGTLGEIFSIDAVMSKLLGKEERKGLVPYTGGSMFELGCHLIDAVVFLLGRPQKVTPYQRYSTVGDDGYGDNGLAVLEYPKATATIRSAMVEVEGGPRRQFVVCGTKGTFDVHPIEPPQAKLALLEPVGEFRKGYQDVKYAKGGGRYDNDLADLAKVIRGEKALAFTPEHDIAVQETILLASGLPIS